MRVCATIAECKVVRQAMPGSVGFVPTMGCLHEGHLALVREARRENDHVAVSIFVNPKQFGPAEDLARYPRDVQRDLDMLTKADADMVFVPDGEEMYPSGFDMTIDVGELARRLEGASRPGHFQGVATVVAKLFNIVEPTRAYCGQKDAQQVVVIRRLVRDLNMNLELRIVPTVREPDGLAMSSRNVYLSPAERVAALALWRSLCAVQSLYQRGERSADALRKAALDVLCAEPLAKVDYVSVASMENMQELERVEQGAVVSLAVWISRTRLIDNIILEPR
ncbi:MAG: pantoate--beta-alanine ligase [Chloroflexi bacterium]|nr:pantoate--beta-alanine ligase [Chloroflexota bacterium]